MSSLQPPKHTSASTSLFPSSPVGSNFTPRKEFVQGPPRQSAFALLAFSSNNAIRLSNFPLPLVTALRTLLDSVIGLHSFRENSEHKLCEIILTGKPWSTPKSLSTEIIIVQVFAVILSHGYTFLSQLDYGREHSDRLSLAFSKLVPSPSPDPLSPGQPKQPLLVPFALSFPSQTILRVVCSPLHATPAILQTVRGAWPRGVTSEKKLGEGCFEFKLKGYSWFHEDTFPEDALAHILTLLTALDKHAWTLLTSISLTSARPRTKDLWIFSGPDPGSSPPKDPFPATTVRPASPVRLGTPLSPSTFEPIVDHVAEGSGSGDSEGSGTTEVNGEASKHVRGATTESPTTLGRSGSRRLSKQPREGHARVASDPASAVLRKKVPPKQISDEQMPGEERAPQPRNTDHDIIPGPPPPPPPPADVIYSTPAPKSRPSPPPPLHHTHTDTIHVSDLPAMQRFPGQDSPHEYEEAPRTPMGPPPSHPLVSLPEPAERHQSEQDFPEGDLPNPHDLQPHENPNTSVTTLQPPSAHALMPQSDVSTPPLLAPTAFRANSADDFRDSAFSDATGQSYDVPITWIPAGEGQTDERAGEQKERGPPPSAYLAPNTNENADDRSSITTGPMLPGGWAPTPTTEIDDPIRNSDAHAMTERHKAVEPRSPELVHPELPAEDRPTLEGLRGGEAWRKSEAGVLGVVPSPSHENAPPVPPVPGPAANGHAKTEATEGSKANDGEKPKEGWVLVSVADSPSPAPAPVPAEQGAAAAGTTADSSVGAPSPGTTHVPLSAAQVIAAVDATSPSPATSSPSSPAPTPAPEKSGLSRLFSRRKASEGGVQKVKSADKDSPDAEKERGGRFRRKGGVLPTIRSGKRISID